MPEPLLLAPRMIMYVFLSEALSFDASTASDFGLPLLVSSPRELYHNRRYQITPCHAVLPLETRLSSPACLATRSSPLQGVQHCTSFTTAESLLAGHSNVFSSVRASEDRGRPCRPATAAMMQLDGLQRACIHPRASRHTD